MGALYIIVAWLVIGTIVLIVLYHRKAFKMTSFVHGEVISAEQQEIRTQTERRDETVVVCRYLAHGREFNIERVFPGRQAVRFPVGTRVPIRYNPAEPAMSRMDVP